MTRLVQSIQRCLTILEYLNVNEGATLQQVCAATGLTRGTAYRVLETLRHEQYLRKDVGSSRYWIAGRVRVLSEGYRDEWWIEQFAAEAIRELGRKTLWPVKLLTLSGHEMITRATTDFESPFTDGKFPTGFRVTLLWSAAGLSYLAFSDDATREVLVKAARTAPQRPSASAPYRKDIADIDELLTRIRCDGYHIADHPETMFYSMAVPVLRGEKPLGAIAIFFYRATVSRSDAVVTYLPLLQQTAADIADWVSRESASRPALR